MVDHNLMTVPVDRRTHQILRVLAAGKGIKMRELLEEMAKPYEHILIPFDTPNGHKAKASHD